MTMLLWKIARGCNNREYSQALHSRDTPENASLGACVMCEHHRVCLINPGSQPHCTQPTAHLGYVGSPVASGLQTPVARDCTEYCGQFEHGDEYLCI